MEIVNYVCQECGKPIEGSLSVMKRRKFCSRECYGNYKSKNCVGENNNFYGKSHSESTKVKLSELRKGKKLSDEIRQKMSDSKKGEKSYNFGKHFSDITKEKLRQSHIGLLASEDTKRKMSESRTGKKLSDLHRLHISESKKGEKNPMFGKPGLSGEKNPMYGIRGAKHPSFGKKATQDTRSKISASLMGKMSGDKNPMYGVHMCGDKSPMFGKHHTEETKFKISELKKGQNMIHGESRQKYCYQFTGKNGVRIRSLVFYGHKCEECGKTTEQNKLENGKSLSVHHVYYRKMSCCDTELDYESGVLRNGNMLSIKESNGKIYNHEIVGKPEKFVVLCTSCHGKTTTFNRYFWIQYYEDRINNKYNGKSFLTKEEYNLFLENK